MGLLDTLNEMASGINENLFNFNAPTSPQEAAERARRNALLAASAPTTDFNRANLGSVLLAGDNAYTDAYNNQMQQDIATNTYNQQMQLQNNLPQILNGMNLDANTKLLLQSMPAEQVAQALSSIALTPKTYKYHFSDQYGVYVTDNKGGMRKIAEAGTEWVDMPKEDAIARGYDPNKNFQINRNGKVQEVGSKQTVFQFNQNTGNAGLIDDFRDKFNKAEESFRSASNNIENFKLLRSLLKDMEDTGFETGALAKFKQIAGNIANTFGVEVNLEGLSSNEMFEAVTNKVIVPLVKQLGRNPTDVDLKFIVASEANLSKTPEGNRLLIEAGMIKAQGELEYAYAVREYAKRLADEGINIWTDPEAIAQFNIASFQIWDNIKNKRSATIQDLRERVRAFEARENLPPPPELKSNISPENDAFIDQIIDGLQD